jgi:hypothetical protein
MSLLSLPIEKWKEMIFSLPIPAVVALSNVSKELRARINEQIWSELFQYISLSTHFPLPCLPLLSFFVIYYSSLPLIPLLCIIKYSLITGEILTLVPRK